jgi:hypothetical protein
MNSNGQADVGYWQMIEMQKDPVAWICKEDDVITNKFKQSGKGGDCSDYTIPLYTHPSEHDLGIAEAIGFDKGYKAATAKTLTDEEITEIYNDILIHDKKSSIKFARAILKKASEK